MFFILRLVDHMSAEMTLMEAVGSGEDYSGLGSLGYLSDIDLHTCLDFKPHWTFRPMVTIRADWSTSDAFNVSLILGSNVSSKIRVFTTSAGTETATTFPVSATYKKCAVSVDESYFIQFNCVCTVPCSYFVQLVYDNMAAVDTSTVKLCEITAATTVT